MLGTGVFWSFVNSEYLHIYVVLSLGWDLRLDTKFTCVSHTPYTHSLKIVLFDAFTPPAPLTRNQVSIKFWIL